MASPTLQRNAENVSPAKPTTTHHNANIDRRPLGEVSPNVKVASQTPAFLSKALAGSPLKRSFTAAMEGGDGLTYLKRRKLSEDEVLSQVDASYHQQSRDGAGRSMSSSGSLRPLFSSREDLQTNIPTIAEPSPTEPNTPSEGDSSAHDSSEERRSFSSLINYDPSSQTSTSIFRTISQAEMLKLRLRVAMYKVRTNQVDKSFPDLEVEERSPASPVNQNAAIEEAVAQLRKEAQEIVARDQGRNRLAVPQLLPAPVLRPTAYSSRMIFDAELAGPPPRAESPERLPVAMTEVDVSTPARGLSGFASPSSRRRRLAGPSEQELTSSAVKGRVAEGLLGLRNAA